MQIRTITGFLEPILPLTSASLEPVASAVAAVRHALTSEGYVVQTIRLALPCIGPEASGSAGLVPLARELEQACRDCGVNYVTLGCVRGDSPPELFASIPDALAATETVFASTLVATPQTGMDLEAVRQTAGVIHRCKDIDTGGFGNLRFAALFNVPPGVPFLPAAYHAGGPPAIAIGVEAADLAMAAAEQAQSPREYRDRLIADVETRASRIHTVASRAAQGIRVEGIDFSLAPHPGPGRSIGEAFERLAGGPLGGSATLAAVAFVADTIDRARFPRVGYSGIFLPVFEDSVLAARAAEGRLSLNDLLLYSSVCGTGLDTVPLPGETGPAALAAILLDVGALSLRLEKPLSARLMPIPGKRAGDEVEFDFPYFAPTRVLACQAGPAAPLIARGPVLDIAPRPWRSG